MTDPVLRLVGIVKTFPGVRALDGVSFSVMPGEVHALMGENGAGKSTLMKVLGGIYQPEEGDIYIGNAKAVMAGYPPGTQPCGRAQCCRKHLPWRTAAQKLWTRGLGHVGRKDQHYPEEAECRIRRHDTGGRPIHREPANG